MNQEQLSALKTSLQEIEAAKDALKAQYDLIENTREEAVEVAWEILHLENRIQGSWKSNVQVVFGAETVYASVEGYDSDTYETCFPLDYLGDPDFMIKAQAVKETRKQQEREREIERLRVAELERQEHERQEKLSREASERRRLRELAQKYPDEIPKL